MKQRASSINAGAAMRFFRSAAAAAGTILIAACVAPTGPVEVTRFHVPEAAELGAGTIAVEPAVGHDGSSLEFRSFAAAVARELNRIGFSEMIAGRSDRVAIVAVERDILRQGRDGGPVSVGVGGTTGSYGSGVGLGIGLDLSGPPPEMIETRLSVTIRDRNTGRVLWEGRAQFAAKTGSPLSQTQLGAAKMAQALFRDFPGRSGETTLVE